MRHRRVSSVVLLLFLLCAVKDCQVYAYNLWSKYISPVGVLDSSFVSFESFVGVRHLGFQLLFGGYTTLDIHDSFENATENEISNDLWQLVLENGTNYLYWTKLNGIGNVPPPMAKHRAFWIANTREMIVFGGFYQTLTMITPAVCDMYSYFFDNNTWVRFNNTPGLEATYTYDNAVVHATLNNSLFQYGGHELNGLSDKIALFDLNTRSWSFLNYSRSVPIPGPRQNHGMAYNEKHNKVYLYGGTNWTRFNPWENPAEYLSDLWEFDLSTNQWNLIQHLNFAVGEFSMLSLPYANQIVIFGGCTFKEMGRGYEPYCTNISNTLLVFSIETSALSIIHSNLSLTRQSSSVLFNNCFFVGGLSDSGAPTADLNKIMYSFGPPYAPFQYDDPDEHGIHIHPSAREKSRDWMNFSGALGGLLTILIFLGCTIAFFVKRRMKKKKYFSVRNLDGL